MPRKGAFHPFSISIVKLGVFRKSVAVVMLGINARICQSENCLVNEMLYIKQLKGHCHGLFLTFLVKRHQNYD